MKKIFCILLFSLIYGNPRHEIFDLLPKIKKHIDQKLEEAEIVDYPSPHFVIEGIFPDFFYKKMQSMWPEEKYFKGARKRGILPVTGGCLENVHLSRDQKIFWRVFGEIIVNRFIKPKIFEKFKYTISMNSFLDCSDLSKISFADFINLRQDSLISDQGKYTIKPHVDQRNIFASLLFYLPNDSSHQDFGTTLYYGPPTRNKQIYADSSLEKVKTVPYKPNTLFCHIQIPNSWHGVEKTNHENNYRRKLYISRMFFSPEFMSENCKNTYKRTISDDYYFDHRFLCKRNWLNVWGEQDHYQ
jgi:hypothetical protein